MRYVDLDGRQASVIGLGVWQFGSGEWGWGSDLGESEADRIVRRALDLGINLFDTAELYGRGRSEQVLGHALAGRRDEAIIASKVSPHHLTHAGVVSAAQRSLQRLGVDAIDLYQVHWPNRFIPIASTMRGMRELLDRGLIRSAGVSNFSLALWRRAEAELGGPLVSNQVQYNLLDQTPAVDLLPYAQREGRVIIAYSPLAQGALGGRYSADSRPNDFRASRPDFSREAFLRREPLTDLLRELAQRHQATPSQVALAWLVRQPQVIAIPGARSVEQVEQNAAAAEIELSQAEADELTRLGREAGSAGRGRGIRRLAQRLLGA